MTDGTGATGPGDDRVAIGMVTMQGAVSGAAAPSDVRPASPSS